MEKLFRKILNHDKEFFSGTMFGRIHQYDYEIYDVIRSSDKKYIFSVRITNYTMTNNNDSHIMSKFSDLKLFFLNSIISVSLLKHYGGYFQSMLNVKPTELTFEFKYG